MELATLARPYANAIFDIADRGQRLAEWSTMLNTLAQVSLNTKVSDMLASPITAAEKAHKVNELAGDTLSDQGRQLVQVLADNQRLDILVDIFAQYEVLRAKALQSLDVEVVSAFPMSKNEEDALSDALGKRFDKEISLTSREDKSLIGGAIIRAGDTVIDGSVRGKLDKLSETIRKG